MRKNSSRGSKEVRNEYARLELYIYTTDKALGHLRDSKRITTLQARSELDVLHPAARIKELRESGLNIVTHWRTDATPEGNPHRVAEYVLTPGKRKAPAATEAKSRSVSIESGGCTDG